MYTKKNVYTVEEALITLQKYCAYQDRCHTEIEHKLKTMGMIPQAADQIIMTLIQDDYLNEERFVMAFVRGKFKIKKWGKIRLKSELKRRHISKYLIEKGLKQISEHEYLIEFEKLANKKAETLGGASKVQKKKKLIDYLMYRGWEPHLIYDKVNQLFN